VRSGRHTRYDWLKRVLASSPSTSASRSTTCRSRRLLGGSARNGRSDQGTRLTAAVDAGVEQFGRLDIIAANTGIGNNGQTLDKTSEPDRDDMIAVDLSGVWKTVKAGVPRILVGRPVRSS
jgi:NAD(P)-dependent dehydrogenase (short-subunit alcohol dehydrogenase family)